jgi:sugar lactone lactonase YvrE
MLMRVEIRAMVVLAGIFAVACILVPQPAATGLKAVPSEIVVNDTGVFPESVTSTKDGTVFFGSIGKGAVYRAAPGSTTATVWIKPGTAGLKSVQGVFADEPARVLWVCSREIDASAKTIKGSSTLNAFNLRTSSFKKSYRLPGNEGFCNDVAVAPDGTAYVSDTDESRVLRLKPGASSLEAWVTDPLLESADGIAVLGKGGVYVNGVYTGSLLRIPIRANGSAGAPVKLQTSAPLKGPDGMRAVGANAMLLAEASGRLDEVVVNGDRAEIRVLKGDVDAPNSVTLVRDTAFVLEGRLNYFFDPKLKGQDPGPFRALAVHYQAPIR